MNAQRIDTQDCRLAQTGRPERRGARPDEAASPPRAAWLRRLRLANLPRLAGLPLLMGLPLLACSPDTHDHLGPRVPIPNVTGAVERAGEEGEDLDVDLRDAQTAVVVAAVETDDDGEYTFSDIGAGRWEVKISGGEDGDFDSVSKVFTLSEDTELAVLPTLDIHGYGMLLQAPTAGGSYPVPSLFSPIEFAWTLPSRSFVSARVQLYDLSGDRVWSSEKAYTETALWNGIGNEGNYAGETVPAGTYYWRVKLELGDETEARTESNALSFE